MTRELTELLDNNRRWAEATRQREPGFAGLANAIRPNTSFGAETMDTFELGWRAQLGATTSLDVALYRSQYRDLRYGTFGAPSGVLPSPAGLLLVVPVSMANGPAAVAHGFDEGALLAADVAAGADEDGDFERPAQHRRVGPAHAE